MECACPVREDSERLLWETRFSHLADLIEETGHLHYYKKARGAYRVIETGRELPDFDNLRAACAKAASATALDGVLRCVVPGATRWVVKKAAM